MKIFEITGFKDAETELPSYDDLLKDPEYFARAKRKKAGIVMMDPKEYIRKAAKGFKKSNPKINVDNLQATRDWDLVDKYAEEMKNGAKFPTLMLNYTDGFSQEGLHRAMAAVKAGIAEVPVLIASTTRRSERGNLKPTY